MSATLANLDGLQSMLSRTVCPNCFHAELEAALRCDLEWRSCLETVHCSRCGYWFEPNTERRAIERIEHRLATGDLEAPCPSCGSRRSRTQFSCDIASHRCCYFLLCLDCGTLHQIYD